jgi:hypothetical protein
VARQFFLLLLDYINWITIRFRKKNILNYIVAINEFYYQLKLMYVLISETRCIVISVDTSVFTVHRTSQQTLKPGT